MCLRPHLPPWPHLPMSTDERNCLWNLPAHIVRFCSSLESESELRESERENTHAVDSMGIYIPKSQE